MSAATQIAAKDLRLRIRDRSAFILGVIAPLSLAIILNFVFGDTFSDSSFDLEYGMVDQDQSEVSTQFGVVLACLEEDGTIAAFVQYDDVASAEAAIEEDEIDAFFLIEPGLGDAVTAGEPASIAVIGDVDAPTSTQIASSIAEGFGEGVASFQLSFATTFALGGTPAISPGGDGGCGDGGPQSFAIVDISAATRQLDTTTYFSAGMAVFFLFFTVQFGVLGLLEERQDGTLDRLIAAPIKRSSIVLGKALLSFLLGVISMGVLITATALLPFMEVTWGAPLGVTLLVVAGVLSAVGIMALVASVAKTPEGAGNLGSIIAVILGLMGGVFFPLGQGDDFLSQMTFLTPHAWFMRGLGDLAGGAEWTAAIPATLALLAFALVFGSVGFVLLNRRLRA